MNDFGSPEHWLWPTGIYPANPSIVWAMHSQQVWDGTQQMVFGGTTVPEMTGVIKEELVSPIFSAGPLKQESDQSVPLAKVESDQKPKVESNCLLHMESEKKINKYLKSPKSEDIEQHQ